MSITLSVEKFMSKKGSVTCAVVLDLGYRKTYLSFDKLLCAELCGLLMAEFEQKPVGYNKVLLSNKIKI